MDLHLSLFLKKSTIDKITKASQMLYTKVLFYSYQK